MFKKKEKLPKIPRGADIIGEEQKEVEEPQQVVLDPAVKELLTEFQEKYQKLFGRGDFLEYKGLAEMHVCNLMFALYAELHQLRVVVEKMAEEQ